MSKLKPFYANVQAHYDLSDEFFALFLDPSRTYSCAFFEREDMTLEEAQLAKIDLSLGKCDLRPGQKLLDIGCGWGSTAIRAAEKYGVDVVGLTLSANQQRTAANRAKNLSPTAGNVEIRLQGWEEFNEPVDNIVSIGAFEHFRQERYTAFFNRCGDILPEGGRMLLHSIVVNSWVTLKNMGVSVTEEDVEFDKFIRREIFPGGQISAPERIREHVRAANFEMLGEQSLRMHYARTLSIWAANLEAAKKQAIALTSQTVYDRYRKYLIGCEQHFRVGHIDVIQFQLQKNRVRRKSQYAKADQQLE